MSEKKSLNIGLVGYGFMGRTHTNGYKRVSDFFPDLGHRPVLKACYGREEDREKLEEFAARWGYESIETDWRKCVERDDIDLVDVCVPNFMHKDCVLAAAEAGKMVICEKPLAMSAAEAEEMVTRLGGRAASSVSRRTDWVVAGPGAGSKLAKAQVLGLKIIGLEEFLALCQGKGVKAEVQLKL